MNQAPRSPTLLERALIAKAIADPAGYSPDEAAGFVSSAWIAVFDDYMPDSPGYCGKVAVVVWPGGVDLSETFIFRSAADSNRPLEAEYAVRA